MLFPLDDDFLAGQWHIFKGDVVMVIMSEEMINILETKHVVPEANFVCFIVEEFTNDPNMPGCDFIRGTFTGPLNFKMEYISQLLTMKARYHYKIVSPMLRRGTASRTTSPNGRRRHQLQYQSMMAETRIGNKEAIWIETAF